MSTAPRSVLAKVVAMLPSSILVDFAKVIEEEIVLLETPAEASVVPPVTELVIDEPEICAKASLPMFSSADAMTAFDVVPVPVTSDKSKLAERLLPTPVAVIVFDNTSTVIAPADPTDVEVTDPPVINASISPVPY